MSSESVSRNSPGESKYNKRKGVPGGGCQRRAEAEGGREQPNTAPSTTVLLTLDLSLTHSVFSRGLMTLPPVQAQGGT